MANGRNAQNAQNAQYEAKQKIAWIIKFVISAVLIYFVITDGGKSSVGETLNLGAVFGGGGLTQENVGNIAVVLFLGAYVVLMIKNAYERFSNKPKTKNGKKSRG